MSDDMNGQRVRFVRCGICQVVNDLLDDYSVLVGNGFECGHCAGLTIVRVISPGWAVTGRRSPQEAMKGTLWHGYVEATEVALRDAWKALGRRDLS